MNRVKTSPFWLVTLVPLLMAFSNCNHQQTVDAGTGTAGSVGTGGEPDEAGKRHATGGAALVTGGTAATGGHAATGGTSATSTDVCELAGERLRSLNCSQQTTPKGIPFATACHNAAAQKLNWHPECIAKVAKCSDVPTAYRGCKP
jgi:hypothetical protein